MIIYEKNKINNVCAVGGKGAGLIKLLSYGLNVPDFFVVAAGTDVYAENFAAELDAFAEKLNCELFAVRSSSINEDGASESFAGQYETKLNVLREDLAEAVRSVASSRGNGRVERYAGHFNSESGKVAVIVQKQIRGELSGVMFTTSPYCENQTVIESVRGSGERLVSGIAAPEEIVFKKGTAPSGTVYEKLSKAAVMLEKGEGKPLDIEWTSRGNELYFLQMRPLTAVGDALPPIPERRWNKYVYRDFCLFAHGVQRIACKPCVQEKAFGFSVSIAEGLIVNGREFYSSESDELSCELWERLDNGNFFETFIKRIKASVSSTKKRADRLKCARCDLDIKDLFALYRREIKAYIKSYIPLMMRPDDYLFGKLSELTGADRAEAISAAAAVSDKKTYYSEERIKFLKAVESGNISGYIDEYEWILNPLGKRAQPMTEARFLKRAEGLTLSSAGKKLKEIALSRKKDKENANKIIEGLNGSEIKLFKLIKEFIYLRTYTAENSDRYFYYLRKQVLANLAKKLNIAEDVLLLMSPEEVLKTESGFRLSAREISKRKSGEAIIISDGESKAFYTGRSYALLGRLLKDETSDGAVLSGRIACMGEARGRVKIVNNLSDAESFEEGCILVTSMTVPEITFALDKACGIITDEGGITCHAAIIAREYAVPCLVGTKCATSVLKDGTIVKLDCVNGKVIIEDGEFAYEKRG